MFGIDEKVWDKMKMVWLGFFVAHILLYLIYYWEFNPYTIIPTVVLSLVNVLVWLVVGENVLFNAAISEILELCYSSIVLYFLFEGVEMIAMETIAYGYLTYCVIWFIILTLMEKHTKKSYKG